MTRRGFTVAALLVLCVAGSGSARAAGATGSHIKLTHRTIAISRITVRRDLLGVSRDGHTFKFRRAAGRLAALRRGKVMLLRGSDAAVVVRLRHRRHRLLVRTRPARLTDVIRSGHIHYSGRPDMHKAFLARLAPYPKRARAAASRIAPPKYPYVGRPARALVASAATLPGISAQGSAGNFGYSLTFTPESTTRMSFAGVLCLQWGSICSNGPSNGVSAEVNVSGYLDTGREGIGFTVQGGRVTHSTVAISHLEAHTRMTYTIARGEGDAGANPPIFRLPVGIDISIPTTTVVPLYFKLQTALEFKLGVSSHNAVIRGGADVSASGSDTLTQNGHRVKTTQTGDQAEAGVLDSVNSDVGLSESAAPSGTVVAVQLPKIGVGLGTRAANGIGYLDLVTSVGQTTGAAYAGQLCSAYDVFFTLGGGLEAQFGPFGVSTPKAKLYEKEVHAVEPGCPGAAAASAAAVPRGIER